MPSFRYRIKPFTHQGTRQEQQDAFLVRQKDSILQVAVVDGMGGYEGGAEAAKLVSSVLVREEDVATALSTANDELKNLNRTEYKHLTESDTPGAVGSLLQFRFREGRVHIGHLGDTRVYLYRDGSVDQLTEDQVDNQSNPVQYFGRSEIEPWIAQHSIQDEDIFIICTDGLYSMFNEYSKESLKKYLEKHNLNPEAAVANIVKDCEKSFTDNATVVFVQFSKVHFQEEEDASDQKAKESEPESSSLFKQLMPILILVGSIVVAFIAGFFVGSKVERNKQNALLLIEEEGSVQMEEPSAEEER